MTESIQQWPRRVVRPPSASMAASRQSPMLPLWCLAKIPYAEWHGDIKSLEYRGPVGDGQAVDMNRPAPEVSPVFDEPDYETAARDRSPPLPWRIWPC